MKIRMTIPALLLTALLTGSLFLPAAMAEDVNTIYDTARAQGSAPASFAETVPLIPGYNAPYPSAAAAQATTASQASDAAIISGSFAATAPAIPGYNAAYPSLTVVVAQD
jgi:hypothetical protein